MSNPKDQIRFILCGTQFASNLGSAARVMKNMGFERLALVRPRCEVGVEARTTAMKGEAILDRAEFHPDLNSAARDLDLLVGATGRFEHDPRCVALRSLAEEILPRRLPGRIGVAFGSEDGGLRREEIELCQQLVHIPTGSSYASLNLAQAVGVVAYELHMGLSEQSPEKKLNRASPEEVRGLLEEVERQLPALNFPPSVSVPDLMRRIQGMADRAALEREDVNMLRGLLRRIGGQDG